ncbi:NAD(P)H-dependent glycerol-3-phosphate dehydrogenase [Romeria aff. gracilis LEGE 07310]|uniref:Glycerol-3-phosphate dehydrogenase [NAD(P)+] n=1 Tax=Vasconcelosia minhoensis LEGE 07310 TaxID=915328 RepID=A0A8J7AI38_9CYAN|nr:NAD(P)H-dependent glycerol-3-phosphate dehydrogenase [Romeria gracilis]MBE9079526.1 NAD(P)H-dependent glycerol-3-phosphate dehydrogenase [Romeria aff. gracilis LEGE 07310]
MVTSSLNRQASASPPVFQTINLTVLGSGAWGSALAQLAQNNQHSVRVWSRRGELSLEEAIAGADVILSAISMKGVAELAERLKELSIPSQSIIATATKGLDPATTRTPSQIYQAAFLEHPIAVLSGPNLSKEIAQGLPAATVIASTDAAAAETLQQVFSSDCFRVYTSPDPLGAELGGTLKNVVAIAVGVCDGLGLGSNAKSALMTRALPEIIRVGLHMGAQIETFYGLSGLGDMLATCDSTLSRNYRVGYGLSQGKALDQILAELGSTAEGVNTAYVLMDIANREGIPVPISRQVHRLLKGSITPREALEGLMERDLKPESCDLL